MSINTQIKVIGKENKNTIYEYYRESYHKSC